MKAKHWRLIPFILFIALGVFLGRGLFLKPQLLPSTQLGKPLPLFQLPMLGEKRVFTDSLMQGQVALLNVWASWCSACLEEQVFLMKLAHDAVPIYGLNYKDTSKDAKHWLKEWGNPFLAVGEDKEGKVAIDLGVYGTPETFLIDKKGIIRYRHVGILNAKIWKREFLPRIKELNGES